MNPGLAPCGANPDSRAAIAVTGCHLAFRFVHTADLHLDAPLRAIALRDPDLARQVGTASRMAFSRIVDLCIAESVAFLVIAGDLWDGAHSSTKTPRFLKQELLRLKTAGIGCFVIRGNHDAMARQTGELDPPDNTTLFGARAGTVDLDVAGHRVAVHGLSFRDPHAPESLLDRYPAPRAGAFNIGLMHTSLNGSRDHDPYAPCAVADLDGHGYDYWALGHIHRRAQRVGRATIVMPGIPQGRDIGEDGTATVTLVDVADDNAITLTQRSVASLRFDRVAVDCAGLTDWADLLAALERAIAAAGRADRDAEHLVIRPTLHGATALAWRTLRDHDRLTDEARTFADAAGIWIDKLDLRLTPGEGVAQQMQLPDDLVRMVMHDLPQDAGVQAAMQAAAQGLLRDLPPELRDMLGDDQDALDRHCQDLLAQGSPAILSRLRTDEGAD